VGGGRHSGGALRRYPNFPSRLRKKSCRANTCALIKSSFGFKLGRVCPYVQASHLIVGETTCDGKKKMFEMLGQLQPVYVMEVPNKKTERSRRLWHGEVLAFKDVIEKLTGNEITAENLGKQSIWLTGAAWPCSGFIISVKSGRSLSAARMPCWLPRYRFTTMPRGYPNAERVCATNWTRESPPARASPQKMRPRILISGSPMAIPNWKLHHIIESAGAVVVCENPAPGPVSSAIG